MTDAARTDFSTDDTKAAVKRAILLNEYLLRRAWGILYLALSLSMFLSTFGTPIVNSLVSIGYASLVAVDMTASGCGIAAILWAFKRVRNAAEITHPEDNPAWSRLLGYRFLVPLWISLNVLVILTIALASAHLALVVLLIHLGVAVYAYYALRLSFSGKIPVEAVIAIGSLALSSIASLALLSIVTRPGPYALLWGATIVAWIFSGVYARSRPVPEFNEERTGLE
ncbi:MAG: hypothetical protein JRN09_00485 [Nitrososphaerota archaeon]|jgi:hypothetical protein|nr:hypothetical protein [Nitrososphaerota archaeon]